MKNNPKNYYEVLEVSPSATSDIIYEAYVMAKNAYTQDSIALYSLISKDECKKILELIEEAYSILSNPEKREQYNSAKNILNIDSLSNRNNQEDNGDSINTEETNEHSSIPRINSNASINSDTSISKKVVAQRFALNFEIDSEIEKDIEQTEIFTGEILKKIREYKKVEIPRMADLTKVSKTYIKNIEEEKLDNLPALVYIRGFVYQYAKCLKLNPSDVANSYIKHIKENKHIEE